LDLGGSHLDGMRKGGKKTGVGRRREEGEETGEEGGAGKE